MKPGRTRARSARKNGIQPRAIAFSGLHLRLWPHGRCSVTQFVESYRGGRHEERGARPVVDARGRLALSLKTYGTNPKRIAVSSAMQWDEAARMPTTPIAPSATEREPERDAARLELPPALALRPSKATSPEVFDGLSMLRAATAAYGDTPASKLRGWPRAPPPARVRAEKHALAHRFLARTQQGPRARPPLQRGWGELPSHILL